MTFIISSRNNLRFLKLCYASIKKLKTVYPIIILDDASTDGTKEWLEFLKDENLKIILNETGERLGICGMFDKGVEAAETEYVMILHADMIVSPNLDTNILKWCGINKIVCATRIEPPLHPPGAEKITLNLGNDTKDLNMNRLKSEFKRLEAEYKDKITEGVFAPWCMRKEDYLKVGGHDQLFAPQSREDSDLFNRLKLHGFGFVQSWDALVYHFTCRGSRFNELSGGSPGKDSQEWKDTNHKSMRNFIRKWGRMVEHDEFMMPIVRFKYDMGLILEASMLNHIATLEPYFNKIYTNIDVTSYIEKEQPLTSYDLSKKFVKYTGHPRTDKNDIVVHVKMPLSINNSEEVYKISTIPYLLDEINEPNIYTIFDGCLIHVNALVGHEYENIGK